MGRSAKTGSGLPWPKGPARSSVVDEVERRAGRRERAVDGEARVEARLLDGAGQALLQEGAERAEPLARAASRRPPSHGRHPSRGARVDRGADGARRGRRRRSSGPSRCRCRRGEGDGEGRAADSAPSAARRRGRRRRGASASTAVTRTAARRPSAERGLGLGHRLLEHGRLDRLALAVEPVELGRDRARLGLVVASISSRAPRAASPIRPPALMRGPSRKPRCQGRGGPSRPRDIHQRGAGRRARRGASRRGPWRHRRG